MIPTDYTRLLPSPPWARAAHIMMLSFSWSHAWGPVPIWRACAFFQSYRPFTHRIFVPLLTSNHGMNP